MIECPDHRGWVEAACPFCLIEHHRADAAQLRKRVTELEHQRANYRELLRFMWRWIDRLKGGQPHDKPEQNWKDYVSALVHHPWSPWESKNWFDDRTEPDNDFSEERS